MSICMSWIMHILEINTWRERDRERQTETEKQREIETDKDRETDRQIDRQTLEWAFQASKASPQRNTSSSKTTPNPCNPIREFNNLVSKDQIYESMGAILIQTTTL